MICLIILRFVNKNLKTLIPSTVIAVFLMVIAVMILDDKMINSAESRTRNLQRAFNLINGNVLLGNGYSREYTTFYGLLNYFIHFGLLGIYPIKVFMRGLKNNFFSTGVRGKMALSVWLFASLMNEACGYTMFFIMIYMLCIFSVERNRFAENGSTTFMKPLLIIQRGQDEKST